jgi:hypothetical protein
MRASKSRHLTPERPHLVEAKRRDAIKLGFERLGSRCCHRLP